MTYRSMIAAQPLSVARCLDAARPEVERSDHTPFAAGTIAVTGIGASFAASIVVAAELARRGRRAIAVRSVDLIGGPDIAESIVALSHRGRSIETVESLQAHPSTPALAITNDADSPLAKAAGRHLRIANEQDATPSTTGYTGTLATAGVLADRLCGADITDRASLPAQLAEVLAAAAEKMPRLAGLFRNRRAIDCVGAGASFGTAEGACLLIREAARIPAAAADTRHYLHGPMEAMDPTTGVILFGDGRELRLAEQLDDIGCPVLLVTASRAIDDKGGLTVVRMPAIDDLISRGILGILSAQLLAAELSDAAGLTDTKFRYPQADTKVP
jgi:glucosamine--fructose-6-phosphate aminotransferase (isomerizing)